MKRNHVFHEKLIPMLVECVGATSYLEFGSYLNDTISRVKCKRRYAVDTSPFYCKDVESFSMTTRAFIENEAAKHAPFDVVFIDASHKAEDVLNDFYGIWDHVSPEGLILLHDTNPETVEDMAVGLCETAVEAAAYITGDGYEAVTLPYHPGLTIIRKREKWGPE